MVRKWYTGLLPAMFSKCQRMKAGARYHALSKTMM